MSIFRKYNSLTTVLFVGITFIACFIAEGFFAADTVKDECLRLHILAASDSAEDQSVKLMIRDEVLKFSEKLFLQSISAEDACRRLEENKDEIEAVADRVLEENGFPYKARLYIEKEYFETREYDNVSLPAGEYTACKIVLGEGEGHNWWCVMFPGICLPSAAKDSEDDVYAAFGKNGGDLVTKKGGYKIRFKIVEVFQELVNRDSDN